MSRLSAALIAYAVLGVLTYLTITDHTIRGVTFAVLALFVVKSVLRRKDVLHSDGGSETDKAESRPDREGHDFSRAGNSGNVERL